MPRYPYLEMEYGNPGPLDAVWPEDHSPEGYAGYPKIENYHLGRTSYQMRTSMPETPGQALKTPIEKGRIYWWVVKIVSYPYWTAEFMQTAFDYWRTNVQKYHTLEYRLTPKRWSTDVYKVLRDGYAVKAKLEAEDEYGYIDFYHDFLTPECSCLPDNL